jgi:3-phosphoshikimate 1-carboxyvinyltransferase
LRKHKIRELTFAGAFGQQCCIRKFPPGTPGPNPLDAMAKPLTAQKSARLRGRIRVPGDKSMSHRAVILGALATGRTRIEGLLRSEDVLATARAVEALGAGLEDGNILEITGQGVGGLRAPDTALSFGNSGTGSRLMMGVVAGHAMEARFTGDRSLSQRPMGRVLAPLKEMGLQVAEDRETLPLTLQGAADLIPIRYALPMASAQVKSAVLLAGLHAAGRTTVVEPEPTRDHTERMLRSFGAEIASVVGRDGVREISVMGEVELEGIELAIPGDPSSAAFIAAAGLICEGSEIVIEAVLMNPTRAGLYETLREMGADIEILDMREQGGEPVADLRVRASALTGARVPAERAPSMIDEYPCLAAIAAFAEGETRMQGLSELKVKESDRLKTTAEGLAACGVSVRIEGDDLIVAGGRRVPGGAEVKTEMDHRIAMAFLTLGLAAEKPVRVDDTSMIATSFPDFARLLASLGAKLS